VDEGGIRFGPGERRETLTLCFLPSFLLPFSLPPRPAGNPHEALAQAQAHAHPVAFRDAKGQEGFGCEGQQEEEGGRICICEGRGGARGGLGGGRRVPFCGHAGARGGVRGGRGGRRGCGPGRHGRCRGGHTRRRRGRIAQGGCCGGRRWLRVRGRHRGNRGRRALSSHAHKLGRRARGREGGKPRSKGGGGMRGEGALCHQVVLEGACADLRQVQVEAGVGEKGVDPRTSAHFAPFRATTGRNSRLRSYNTVKLQRYMRLWLAGW
jgi:hypothetical protein